MSEAYKWIEEETGQTCSPLARKVAHILQQMARGWIAHCPVDFRRSDWTNQDRIEVIWDGVLSNYDNCDLTDLWAWSAAHMVRVVIRPPDIDLYDSFDPAHDDPEKILDPCHLRLVFFKRENREGNVTQKLPTARGLIELTGAPLDELPSEGS